MIEYLRIVALGVPGLSVFLTVTACLRGAGDSVRPLQVMCIVNVVNIAGQLASCRAPRSSACRTRARFDLGVAGIAWGTAAGWTVGAVGVAMVALRSGVVGRASCGARRLRFRTGARSAGSRRWRCRTSSRPSGMWVGNYMVIFVIRAIGADGSPGVLGSHIIAIRAESLSFLPGFAMSMAAGTLAGQYLGAQMPKAAKRAGYACAAIGAAIMGSLGLAYMLIPRTIVRVFSDAPEHMEHTPMILVIAGAIQIPFAVGMVLRGALRGAGDTTVVMAHHLDEHVPCAPARRVAALRRRPAALGWDECCRTRRRSASSASSACGTACAASSLSAACALPHALPPAAGRGRRSEAVGSPRTG